MSLPTFSMSFEWKKDAEETPWKIWLPDFEAWMRANAGEHYCGNSADSEKLTLWFMEEPTQEIKDEVQAAWDLLDQATEEAKAQLAADREAAVEDAKEGVLAKSWDAMIAAERKVVMNQTLSDADKDALLAVYPQ